MQKGTLYHETQVAALCGVHAINTLLQGPVFSEIDLAQVQSQKLATDSLPQTTMLSTQNSNLVIADLPSLLCV